MSLRKRWGVEEGKSKMMKDESYNSSSNNEAPQKDFIHRFSPKDAQTIGTLQLPITSSKIGLFTLTGFGIVTFQVVCEVLKQISNYSMQYYNDGEYVIASTAMVVTTEILKLIFTRLRMDSFPSFDGPALLRSIRYMVPSILYAVNNNIYFYGLTLVPPPIWLILCSMRTLVTAFLYRFILKRQINYFQYGGIAFIVSSLIIAKIPDLLYHSVNSIPMFAIILALLASCISALAAIYTETLFKVQVSKDEVEDSFLVKQFWLYFYGIFISSAIHFVSHASYTILNYMDDIRGMSQPIFAFYIVALLCSSIGGITVASILKHLDNIVKEYSGSFGNILTALLSSYLFPDKFQFTIFTVLSLLSLIVGILLYETKKTPSKK